MGKRKLIVVPTAVFISITGFGLFLAAVTDIDDSYEVVQKEDGTAIENSSSKKFISSNLAVVTIVLSSALAGVLAYFELKSRMASKGNR